VEYLVWGGGLAASVLILVLLGRIALRLLQEAQEVADRKEIDSRIGPTQQLVTVND
jgi:hypothetical protein